MSGINPYAALFLNASSGGQNPFAVQQGQVISIPKDLSSLATSIILKGEVTSSRPDGATSIKTPKGEINARFNNPPSVGTKLDIQLPAGQPPRQIIAQPTLASALQNQQLTTQTSSPQTQQTQGITVPISSQVIADVKNLQSTVQSAKANPFVAPSILTEGQSVRLTFLPPAYQNSTAIQNFPVNTATQSGTTQFIFTSFLPALAQGSFRPLGQNFLQQTLQSKDNAFSVSQSGMQSQKSMAVPTSSIQMDGISSKMNMPDFTLNPIRVRTTPAIILPQNISVISQIGTQTSQTITTATIIKPGTPLPQTITQSQSITPNLDYKVMTIINQNPRIYAFPSTPQLSIPQSFVTPPPEPSITIPILAGQIVAHSTGHVTTDGNPIVMLTPSSWPASPSKFLSLNYPATNLPAGSSIILTPTATQPIAKPTPSIPQINISPATSAQWPTMQSVLNNMAMFLPLNALNQFMTLIPTPDQPKQFPAAALLFLAAAKGGDLSGWMGTRTYKLLDNAPPSIKKTIINALQDIPKSHGRTAMTGDPVIVQTAPEWRGHPIPMLVGGDVHQAHLWTKYQDDQSSNDGQKRAGGTRFIVDLKLSRMGDVQFDGYIDKTKQVFNLSLITQKPVQIGMQDILKSLWYKTLEGLDLSGNISFKHD